MKVQFNISTVMIAFIFIFFRLSCHFVFSWNPKLDSSHGYGACIRSHELLVQQQVEFLRTISDHSMGHSTRVCRAIFNLSAAEKQQKKNEINELSNSMEAMPASHTKHETNTSHHFAHIFGRKLFDVEMLYGTCEAIEWLQQIVTPRFPDTIYVQLRDNGELVRK